MYQSPVVQYQSPVSGHSDIRIVISLLREYNFSKHLLWVLLLLLTHMWAGIEFVFVDTDEGGD